MLIVITSYSIHYTKLYETVPSLKKSFNEIVMDYNDMISQNQWNPVRTYGFARSSLSSSYNFV